MLTKLWEKIGEGIARHWILKVAGPAFIFWAGGCVAYAMHFEISDLLKYWSSLLIIEKGLLIIGALILLIFSASIVERFQTNMLRLMEGYWPHWLAGMRFRLAKKWSEKIEAKLDELETLKNADTPHEIARKSQLDNEIARLPVDENYSMPTLLGNLLRAAEAYSEVRYGLDAIVCWPRLYPLLSNTLRQDIIAARNQLNENTRLLVWSMLFVIWTIWQWWALIGLFIAWLAYRWMIIDASVYGDLIRTAYDLHRFDLYKALCWPLPDKPINEEELGRQLTEYLFRGIVQERLSFKFKKEEK